MEVETLTLILISISLGIAGQLCLKHGINNFGHLSINDFLTKKIFQIIFQKFVFLGILLYAIATFLWLIILSKTELSIAYPMLAIGYIIIAILSKILFNENLTLLKFIGIVLISIGVFILLKK
ncbi:MAG: EamA family transporter [Candidatus Aenigmatarchaeota archaeon]